MSNILDIATSPIRAAIDWIRDGWDYDPVGFILELIVVVLLGVLVLMLIAVVVGFILALTGVIPMGHGDGGTSHYMPHPIIVPHIHFR